MTDFLKFNMWRKTMLVIAENLNARNAAYMDALKKKDKKVIEAMAKELAKEGADIIMLQCSPDGAGDQDLLPVAVEAAQRAGLPLCLDTRNDKALAKAVPLCKEPPIVNYLSADEKNADEILDLVRNTKASLVLRALKGTVPMTLEAKLMILEELIEKANEADIPNERLFADPSVVHIGRAMGQEHLMNAHECIIALNEMVDPPINTIVWLSNVTTGLAKKLKPRVASAYLCYLAGAGLNAAFINVLDNEVMKAVYLIKAFRDAVIFSPADIS